MMGMAGVSGQGQIVTDSAWNEQHAALETPRSIPQKSQRCTKARPLPRTTLCFGYVVRIQVFLSLGDPLKYHPAGRCSLYIWIEMLT